MTLPPCPPKLNQRVKTCFVPVYFLTGQKVSPFHRVSRCCCFDWLSATDNKCFNFRQYSKESESAVGSPPQHGHPTFTPKTLQEISNIWILIKEGGCSPDQVRHCTAINWSSLQLFHCQDRHHHHHQRPGSILFWLWFIMIWSMWI